MNPLIELQKYGQSVWLDYIRRSLISSGELERYISEDGVQGVTSNPAIFEKAIAGSNDYSDAIKSLEQDRNLDSLAVYEMLAVKDIQDAADVLHSVYQKTKRRDGYVSLEVSPALAWDTKATVAEAKRLWKLVNKENVMIKVPATPAGIPAIQELISNGININVTLLFAQQAYEQVAEAYISGLEKLLSNGGDISRVASVASFFISRIDTAIDIILNEQIKVETDGNRLGLLKSIMGKVAIANGKLTYQKYQQIFSTPRWKALSAKGAQSQRVLWASTGTKNPSYSDVLYVEELIGPDTVNTIPPATLQAFNDHGKPRASLVEHLDAARTVMENLSKLKISMTDVTDKLLHEGVKLFADPFQKLLGTIEKQRRKDSAALIDHLSYSTSDELKQAIEQSLNDWRVAGKLRRLWSGDTKLWTNKDENKWLGWLDITAEQLAHTDVFKKLAEEIKSAGFTHALLLGMGGSSLCPEVMKMTFGHIHGFPELFVLDSTDPAQVETIKKKVDLAKTIFIVSSKSGSTLEPNIFKQYFFEEAKKVVGKDMVGQHFIAITDPGSKMQQVAEHDKFRHIFFGLPTIGGRYSALSNFGMIPAAIMGVDVEKFLDFAEEMVQACAPSVPIEENPGVVLGTILGVLNRQGKDKVTLIASPGISDLGAWLEQLLAESTGKQGKGIIPVGNEHLGSPALYGKDRIFVYLKLETGTDPKQDQSINALEKAGQPVVRISIPDTYHLGQEFFRWEMATAVAGSIIGINAFDQPDVEASKLVTRELTSQYESKGSLPAESPIFEADGIKLYTDEKNATALLKAVGSDSKLSSYLKAHLNRISSDDYFALLGYIEMNQEHEKALQEIRHLVRDSKKVATCLGFGPRFLHSTGQAYKGGPNSGVFLQITCDDAVDVPVPDQKYTFGVVKAAQARGDFQVLADRSRRVLRIHLSSNLNSSLPKLKEAMVAALA